MSWLRIILLPFAILYGFIVWVRNLFFDYGILPSESFHIPVISVGNLSVGGTGKTPHVEYLAGCLKDRYTIGVLSRGYKRKTRGYVVVRQDSGTMDVGDEPLQVKRKFPEVHVAVHENRRRGIRALLHEFPDIDLILLDDAFQHRYVKPGLNLLLTGYYNPFFRSFLLPVGNLRESKKGAGRADAIIVSKTPKVFSPLDRRYFLKRIGRYHSKDVFFSRLHYKQMLPLTVETPVAPPLSIKTIFLLTGIANPTSLEEYLKTLCQELVVHRYPDHHAFNEGNLLRLQRDYKEAISHCKIIVTTEKDAMRLRDRALLNIFEDIPVYYLPIEVVFHEEDKLAFNNLLSEFLSRYR
ncbi:MAG: tetraacyldisaccharide 4'-kinase [Bacteroidia bacterium]|nr:MAG: tetraacyldisaccharide 4'-kinase [Bacteroidia bacterium]